MSSSPTTIKEEEKRLIEYFLSQDVLYEIILFIDSFNDFISLSKVNKYFYNSLFVKENEILNYMIKQFNIKIKLNNELLPNYLFKINYLRVELLNEYNLLNKFTRVKQFIENDFNLLNKFKNLKYLEISNDFPENHNYIFPKLDNLEELKLSFCNLPNNSLQNLNHLKKLELISINKDIKINLENCINLTYLFVINSSILENSLQNLTNLEKITLIDSRKDLQNKVDFSNLKKLKYLKIEGIIIDTTNFNKLPNLEELTCCLEEIDNLNNLKQIKKLKIGYLEINKNINKQIKRITDKDLMELPNIVELNVQQNRDITGECLLKLINLEKLNINNTVVKDEYLINLQKLKYLDISFCNNITGECLLKLTNLEKLLINYTNTKDEHLINLKQLKYLYIFYTYISGECFQHLPALREIEIDKLKIKKEYLEELKNKRPCVKITYNTKF